MIRVIIADDERMVRRAIRSVGLWEKNGMEIVGEAADGLEALVMIEKEKPDLVFLDMRMPGMSGCELLKELAKKNINPAVVVISGYDEFEYARIALQYGAVDYLLKPINRNEFNNTLKRLKNLIEKNNQEKGSKVCVDIPSQIKERIDKEYTQDISLAIFSEEFYMNKDVLSRLYKRKYGIGITKYINKVRLEQAKLLLMLGYTSTQAAEMVGYHDGNYFSRIFKKTYSMTPSEFVDAAEENSDKNL